MFSFQNMSSKRRRDDDSDSEDADGYGYERQQLKVSDVLGLTSLEHV
jgi:hypothetical protein